MNIRDIYWGEDSAELDEDLLEYFVYPSDFQRLETFRKTFIVGRKGSGKSAIRKKLKDIFLKKDNHIIVEIIPTYTVIKSICQDSDINANFSSDIFFQYVWLKYFCERALLKIGDAFQGRSVTGSFDFARTYALQSGECNLDLVETISALIQKIKVKAGTLGELGLHIDNELKQLTNTEALKYHINKIAEKEHKIIYIIDDLDLGWDNSVTSNNLLLGLLLASNHLKSLNSNIHTFVFIRDDIYKILMDLTQHSDKFRDIMYINWDIDKLKQVIDERIIFNYRSSKLEIPGDPFHEIFPNKIGTTFTMNWLNDRTLNRPRELLQLCRTYTENVPGTEPDQDVLKRIEEVYSNWKLDDLCSEFSNKYPDLSKLFNHWKANLFRIKYHLNQEECEGIFLDILSKLDIEQNWYLDIKDNIDIDQFLLMLYEMGFIGDFILGGQGGSKTVYSNDINHTPKLQQIQIHSCFRRAIGTVERIR